MAVGRQMMEIMSSRLERLFSEHESGLAGMVNGEPTLWGPKEIAIGRAALAFYESWLRAKTEEGDSGVV